MTYYSYFDSNRPQYISLKALQHIRLLGIVLTLIQFIINVAKLPLANQFLMISQQGNWATLLLLSISYGQSLDSPLFQGSFIKQCHLLIVEISLVMQPVLTFFYWTTFHSFVRQKIVELAPPHMHGLLYIANVCLHTIPCFFICLNIIFAQCRFKIGHWRFVIVYILFYTVIYVAGCEVRGKWIYPFLPYPEQEFYPRVAFLWVLSMIVKNEMLTIEYIQQAAWESLIHHLTKFK